MGDERDKELDGLMSELKGQPFIHKPDDLPINDGSSCWLNQLRECNADCRAYDVTVDPEVDGPAVCIILGSLMRPPPSTAEVNKLVTSLIKSDKDKQRREVNSIPIPDPTGRKRP